MRVYRKQVKDCETTAGVKEKVLTLWYSFKGEKGLVQVRNYDEKLYKKIRATLELELETLLKEKAEKIEEAIKNLESNPVE